MQVAVRATTGLGKPEPRLISNSTDANVPMSLGIPAVIMANGGESGGWHTRAEWFAIAMRASGAMVLTEVPPPTVPTVKVVFGLAGVRMSPILAS